MNQAQKDNYPLMTKEWVEIISNFINSHSNIAMLEYGSGNSTTFWAEFEKIKKLVSVEADSEWYNKVCQRIDGLNTEKKEKIYYKFINVNQEKLKELNKKGGIISWNDHKQFWKPYCDFLDELVDDSFDLIIIDGYDRKRTFLDSLKKLKKGGWIIMHDMLPSEFDNLYSPKDKKIIDLQDFKMVFNCHKFGNGRGNQGFVLEKIK